MQKLTAIITARGGSKGLPRKNILPLNGKPLIGYTIQAALRSEFVKDCFVSTEDPEIQNISLAFGAKIIERPQSLAQDNTTSADTILHALDVLKTQNQNPKNFMLLQPTSPLRTSQDINQACEIFFANQAKSLVSVCEVPHHPYKTIQVQNSQIQPLKNFQSLETPRQKLPEFYQINGAIYIVNSDQFTKQKKFIYEDSYIYQMSSENSIDISNQPANRNILSV